MASNKNSASGGGENQTGKAPDVEQAEKILAEATTERETAQTMLAEAESKLESASAEREAAKTELASSSQAMASVGTEKSQLEDERAALNEDRKELDAARLKLDKEANARSERARKERAKAEQSGESCFQFQSRYKNLRVNLVSPKGQHLPGGGGWQKTEDGVSVQFTAGLYTTTDVKLAEMLRAHREMTPQPDYFEINAEKMAAATGAAAAA